MKTLVAVVLTLALGAFAVNGLRASAQEGIAIPAAVVDTTAEPAEKEIAILAGGCFWGVQAVFQHLDGVVSVVSGYAGGEAVDAQYGRVGTGATNHAEVVKITFDPRKISYGKILQVLFSVAHDPTQLNRQGPDRGTQYRSAIFPTSEEQARIAKAYIGQLDAARVYKAAIVTKIEPGRPFYAAEAYHQDFMTRNPNHPYIVINDRPKVEALKTLFPERYRAKPVLVSATGVK